MHVAYCRTGQRSWEGIEKQKKICSQFLNSKNLSIDEFFIDDGFPGTQDDRTQLTKMISQLEKIESITVSNVDRLFRDPLRLLEFFKLLESKGIKLFDAATGTDIISSHNGLARQIILLGNKR